MPRDIFSEICHPWTPYSGGYALFNFITSVILKRNFLSIAISKEIFFRFDILGNIYSHE